jgi:diphthamide biosynthesis protein 7
MTDNSNESKAATHQEITLELNADVAEWCPLASSTHRRLLAAGTYQLNEATQKREGRLYIYKSIGEIRKESKLSLHCATTYDLPGIFDLKWLPENFLKLSDQEQQPTIAAALADGSVTLLQVINTDTDNVKVVEISRVESPEGGMALSLDYRNNNKNNDGASAEGAENIMSSYSDGSLATHQVTTTGITTLHSWQGHELEAWTCSFDNWNPNLAYSGGDDCFFKGWDLRCDGDAEGPNQLWLDRKSHSAGVCCIVSSPFQPHVVVTGSYDEKARLWDSRQGESRPLAVAEVGTGGGVWRLKWHPTDPNLLLAACMHGGFTILRANATEGSLEVVERYPHQQTLAYGSGWCSEVGSDGTSVAATASFYDRLLHIWSPQTIATVSTL